MLKKLSTKKFLTTIKHISALVLLVPLISGCAYQQASNRKKDIDILEGEVLFYRNQRAPVPPDLARRLRFLYKRHQQEGHQIYPIL